MNSDIICIIALAITAISSAVSVVGFVMAKFVNNVAGKPDDIKAKTSCCQHGNIADVNWPTIPVTVHGPCAYIDAPTRRDDDWINALVERKIGPSFDEIRSEVFESGHGDWNLAHIYDPNDRGPGFTVFIPKGQNLVNVGARELRFVVGPVPTDLPNGPERAPTGHDGTDGGHEGKDKRQNLKVSHGAHYSISPCDADAILMELRGEAHSEMFKRTVTRLVENARPKRRS